MLQVNIECTESDSVMRKKCTETHFLFFFFLARERVRCRRNRMQSKEKRMTFFVVVVVASFLQQHDDTFLGSHCQPTARGKKLRSNSFMSTTRSRKIKICMKHKMPTPGNEHGCYSSTLITCFSKETIFVVLDVNIFSFLDCPAIYRSSASTLNASARQKVIDSGECNLTLSAVKLEAATIIRLFRISLRTPQKREVRVYGHDHASTLED